MKVPPEKETKHQITAEQVSSYLMEHPHFLIEYPEVLSKLILAESHHPDVTSLVARQHQYFQKRIQHLEQEVSQILALATEHEHTCHHQLLSILELLQVTHFHSWIELAFQITSQYYGVQELLCSEVNDPVLEELWNKASTEGVYAGRLDPIQSKHLESHQNLVSAFVFPVVIGKKRYTLSFAHHYQDDFSIRTDPFFFHLLCTLLNKTWSHLQGHPS